MLQAPIHTDERVVFFENFNSEQETRKRGGVPTDVVYDNGVGTFNGASSFISYRDYIVLSGNASFRARIRTSSALGERYFSRDDGVGNRDFGLYITGGNAGFLWNDGAVQTNTGSVTINDGLWHEIIAVNDGTDTHLYVDGVLDNTEGGEGGNLPQNSNIGINIGRRNDNSQYYTGDIDLIEIRNYALTASEVLNLYENKTYKELGHGNILEVSALSGTPFDRMGATLVNTGVQVEKNPAGRVMYFDGTADLDLGETYTLSRLASTIEVWFNTFGLPISVGQFILGYNHGAFKYLGFNGTDLFLESNTNGDLWLQYAQSNFNNNVWYHLVVIADGGTVNSYVNNILVDTTTPTDDVTFQYIGNNSGKDRDWLGYIGSVRFWDRALSVAEGSQLFSNYRRFYR